MATTTATTTETGATNGSRTPASIGRTIGVLYLLQMVLGYVVNFVLLKAAVIVPPGFLVNAATHPFEINLAALLMLVLGAIAVGIALTALPVFRRHSPALAIGFIVLAVVNVAGLILEGVSLRAMLSLSQEYVEGEGASRPELFEAPKALARAFRNSAHYINLLTSGGSLLLLYGALHRFRLVPRPLAVFGLATVALLILGALVPLLGYRTVMWLFMPIGLAQLALVSWLLYRGFAQNELPGSASAASSSGVEGRPRMELR